MSDEVTEIKPYGNDGNRATACLVQLFRSDPAAIDDVRLVVTLKGWELLRIWHFKDYGEPAQVTVCRDGYAEMSQILFGRRVTISAHAADVLIASWDRFRVTAKAVKRDVE